MRFKLRRLKLNKLKKIFLLIVLCLFYCEYLVFYIYINSCNWPIKDGKNLESFNLKAIALSDLHLYGTKRGYWFDKLKREWQMYISFKFAIELFEPSSAFILGDIFDEGLIAETEEFDLYFKRFNSLFKTKNEFNLIVSPGNHDIGFHDRMLYFDPFLRRQFEKAFNSTIVLYKKINGTNIISINSMAMYGDGCHLCDYALEKIEIISSQLFENCKVKSKVLCNEQRPILLSHFPLYRKNDLDCNEPDSNYNIREKTFLKSNRDCLSKISTNFIFKKLQPKLVIDGHTHYGCVKTHLVKIHDNTFLTIKEWTLSSFNWKNRPNPSFILLLADKNSFQISKCLIPNENHLFFIYFLTFLYIVYLLNKR